VDDVFALTPASRAFFAAAARAAADELDLFPRLPATLDGLAAALGVAPRRLRALVDVLALEGLVRREQAVLVRGAIPPPPPRPPRTGWGLLADVLRSDRPLPEGPLAGFHEHLARAGAAAARATCAHLAAAPGPLLDLGGGAGAYTAAWLEARPGDRALLVDRAEVCALADRSLARFGSRAATRAGDLFGLDLGRDHGVALLANVLHLYPPEACAALVARAAAAVAPGGVVAVKDLIRASPAGVYFALNMALYTDGGTVHDAAAVAGWLAAAGLAPEAPAPLGDAFILVARRPA
jgi:hypothetical protein